MAHLFTSQQPQQCVLCGAPFEMYVQGRMCATLNCHLYMFWKSGVFSLLLPSQDSTMTQCQRLPKQAFLHSSLMGLCNLDWVTALCFYSF